MLRIHNTREGSLQTVSNRAVEQERRRKPNGLWYADGLQWHNRLETGKIKGRKAQPHDYLVELSHDANICRLKTWEDILEFTKKYGATYAPGGLMFWQTGDQTRYDPNQDEGLIKRNSCRVPAIDWVRVARDFDGIEIVEFENPVYDAEAAKFGLTGRPRAEWLDIDWEVSSGCIWAGNVFLAPFDRTNDAALDLLERLSRIEETTRKAGHSLQTHVLSALRDASLFANKLPAGFPSPQIQERGNGYVTLFWENEDRSTRVIFSGTGHYKIDYLHRTNASNFSVEGGLFDNKLNNKSILPERFVEFVRELQGPTFGLAL